ncbi:MAG: hypothetical protein QOH12_3013 [Solirubrobacteraceae bacterium]|jgi:hypothetical protein|nr:hypothetical protein [Solirubrobacteraceae bacterium]
MGRARGRVWAAAGGGDRRGSRRPWKWTEERLLEELEDFLADHAAWPPASAFRAAGREDLYHAMVRHGGVEYWREELGMFPEPGATRPSYGTHRAVEDARELIDRLGFLPNTTRVRALGFPRLATRIQVAGGTKAFCRLHGLPQPPSRAQRDRDQN